MSTAQAEVWLPIAGYEGAYAVSSWGRVRSEARVVVRRNGWRQTIPARILAAPANKDGYPYVRLPTRVEGKFRTGKTRLVHHLVLEAFVGPRPDGTMCCHKDGNPANPRLDNLRWDTAASNAADALKHGVIRRGEGSPHARLTADQVRAIRADTRQYAEIARDYAVTCSHISHIKARDVWAHI